jgi:dUTPase
MSATKQLLDSILKPYEATLTFEYCLLTDTAKAPVKNDPNAVGWDIYPDVWRVENGYLEVYTNVAVKPPAGYYFGFYPRSSQTNRNDVFGNSVGVIEPDYRGGLIIRLKPVGKYSLISNDIIVSDFKQDDFDIEEELRLKKNEFDLIRKYEFA